MQSTDLNKYSLGNWQEIRKDYNYTKELIIELPHTLKGVYIVRANKVVRRLLGESDIIYIGQGTIRSRIQQLLRSYLPTNFRDYTNNHTAREGLERILNETEIKLEFSFYLTESSKEDESQLLQEYCRDHIEPPPLNNTRI